MAIVLADLLDAKNVELALRPRTAENAVRELIGLLAANEQVPDADKLFSQVMAREHANPSMIERGVAFPHARTDAVEKIVLAIGRSRFGVSFGEQKERARLVFLIGVPQRLVSDYLVCVGALARMAKDEDIRSQLLHASTAEEFIAILRAAAT